jgi:hypothetical protein
MPLAGFISDLEKCHMRSVTQRTDMASKIYDDAIKLTTVTIEWSRERQQSWFLLDEDIFSYSRTITFIRTSSYLFLAA